jgi:hypothetical protein
MARARDHGRVKEVKSWAPAGFFAGGSVGLDHVKTGDLFCYTCHLYYSHGTKLLILILIQINIYIIIISLFALGENLFINLQAGAVYTYKIYYIFILTGWLKFARSFPGDHLTP